jgi:hypothetical protein
MAGFGLRRHGVADVFVLRFGVADLAELLARIRRIHGIRSTAVVRAPQLHDIGDAFLVGGIARLISKIRTGGGHFGLGHGRFLLDVHVVALRRSLQGLVQGHGIRRDHGIRRGHGLGLDRGSGFRLGFGPARGLGFGLR